MLELEQLEQSQDCGFVILYLARSEQCNINT